MARACGTFRGQVRCVQVVGRSEGKEHLEDLGLDGRAILKWIFKKRDGGMNWIDLSQDRESWGGDLVDGVKFGGFIDYLSTYETMKKDCAPWT